MATYGNLVANIPSSSAGVLAGNGTDRFLVQMAIPPSGADLLGVDFILGTSTLQDIVWTDITENVAHVAIERGTGDPADTQPETGTLGMQLINPGDNRYHPVASLYNGPGTYVRVCWRYSGTWYFLFTGLVESWQTVPLDDTGDYLVEVECAEAATKMLAEINDNAGPTVGTGEDAEARLARLVGDLPYTVWLESPFNTMTFQSTDMADNRLAEVKLVARSVDAIVFARGDGTLYLRQRGDTSSPGTQWELSDYVKNSLVDSADEDTLVGTLYLSRREGTERAYVNEGYAGQFLQRSSSFNDFRTDDDADLDVIAERWLARGNIAYKLLHVSFHKEQGSAVRQFIFTSELGDMVTVDTPIATYEAFSLAYKRLEIAPRIADFALEATCTIGLGIEHHSTVVKKI